jgi:NADPH2:quinone reductase
MRAVEISRPGGPEVLRLTTRPVPQPGAGEVLIEVSAAGINRPDCLQRAGVYPAPPGASDLPGLEISGRIAMVGEGVSQWKQGDLVCALTPGGGYAQYCVTPASHCLPIPVGLTPAEAASLPETFFTVWINVFDRAGLASGETLLVQGGSSGIGVTAIQMAHAFGNRVFATAGTEEKCTACETLGAERCINYATEDFVEAINRSTDGKGVDVILDMVGGDYVPRELKCLAIDGRLSLIGFQRGDMATLNMTSILMRRLTVTGSTLRPRTVEYKAATANVLREKVWPLIESGQIRPVIYKSFPLTEAAQAHALMESGAHVGKIVLEVAHERRVQQVVAMPEMISELS